MKAEKEHRVPLCDAALALVDELRKSRQGDVVFHGARSGRPIDNPEGKARRARARAISAATVQIINPDPVAVGHHRPGNGAA
jgi:integrase